jgi:hypothetical protein
MVAMRKNSFELDENSLLFGSLRAVRLGPSFAVFSGFMALGDRTGLEKARRQRSGMKGESNRMSGVTQS